MRCDTVRDRIPLWVSGDLDKNDMENVQVHLMACPACRRAQDEMRRAVDSLAALRRSEAPADTWNGYWEGIRDATFTAAPVRRLPPARLWLHRHGLRAAMAVAAGMLIVLSIAFFRNTNTASIPDTPVAAHTETAATPVNLADIPAMAGEPDYEAGIREVLEYLRAKEQKERARFEIEEMDGNPHVRLADY